MDPSAPNDDSPRVHFAPPGAFARELKRRSDAYFDGPGGRRRDLPAMYLKSAVILAWWAGSWGLLVFVAREAWQATLLAVSLGLSIVAIGTSVQHDANHGAYSRHPLVNRLFGLTLDAQGVASFIWRRKHNVMHHSFTNLRGVDFDLDFGLIARLSPEQPRRAAHRYQHLYLWALYGFLLPKWAFYDDFVILLTRRMGPHRLPEPSRVDLALFVAAKVFFVAWALVIPALFHPLWQVAVFFLVAVYTLGVTLSSVFQLAHCVDAADFPAAPPPGEALEWDFAEHQLHTTVGFGHGNRLLTWFLGGLNHQVEHHLFPKVCHLHYPALARIVAAVAAEHGIRYRTHGTLGDALASHFAWLRGLGAPSR